MRSFGHKYDSWRVFGDFCELAALSIYNSLHNDEVVEKRYMEVVGRYTRDEAKEFSKMLGCVVEALERDMHDFLGGMFMELELSNHWIGQFFTPDSLCQVMANMTIGDGEELKKRIEDEGLVTLSEPACGAGATIIAWLKAARGLGINYQQSVYVEAVDISATAAHMAYIQLALLGCPARVFVGNTLSMEMQVVYTTPAYWMGSVCWKVKRWRESQRPSQQKHEVVPMPIEMNPNREQFGDEQLQLFVA